MASKSKSHGHHKKMPNKKPSDPHSTAFHPKETSNPVTQETATEPPSHDQSSTSDSSTSSETHHEESPIRVEFPYSEVVRSYVPDAMAVADRALADWKQEGSFMNLGIENPYANMAVSLGLQNAKKIEKKLEEKGVLPVVRMGIEVLKNKVKKA